MTSSSRSVRVGLIQHACGEDRQQNLEAALSGIREAASGGAQLICLQELFASVYFCQTTDPAFFDLAEPVDGQTVKSVGKLAKELGVTVLTSIFEERAPGLHHNTLVVIGPDGSRLGVYRKMHIPEDPQFEEKFYFAPGDTGFMAVDTPVGKVGTLVCWDQWYPEAARLTAMQGAQILFYPTAIGWLPEEKAQYGEQQLSAWQTMQRSHAIANGVFVAAVNRVGTERSPAGSIEFWGRSFICGPDGAVIVEGGEAPTVLVAECDLAKSTEVRRTWPFFRDRRIDAYGNLLKRWTE